MLIKLFALGRPGSGKSVAAHRLAEAAWNNGLPAIRLGDYELLHREALREEDACLGEVSSAPAKRRFYITEHNGFGVYDFTVLDDVLIALRI